MKQDTQKNLQTCTVYKYGYGTPLNRHIFGFDKKDNISSKAEKTDKADSKQEVE